MDFQKTLCVLTLHSIMDGVIKTFDVLTVSAPSLVIFGVSHPVVRVDAAPYQILLNGNKITQEQTAWIEMRVRL